MAAAAEDPVEDSMARNHTLPGVGELWRATDEIFIGDVGYSARLPAGALLLVIGSRQGSIGLQFRVLQPGGSSGWVSEHCSVWERVNATG
jgi:hypothetical protein